MLRHAASTVPAQVSSLLRRAEFHAAHDRHAQAKVAFRAGIEFDTGPTARNAFGCYLTLMECYGEAIEQFSILLAQAKKLGDEDLRSVASNNMASVYRAMGCVELAARFQQQSIQAESRVDPDSTGDDRVACDFSNRALDAMLAGEFDLAENLLRRSLSLELTAGTQEGQAADWGNLGVLAGLQGDTTTGINYLWRAYRLHALLNDDRGAGCDLMNLAELYGNLGHRQVAVHYLKKAVRRLERAQAARTVARARRLLEEATRTRDVLERDLRLN